MRQLRPQSVIVSACPILIISGLLYAALFVKPSVNGSTVRPPAVARGDYFYGLASPVPGSLWAVGSDGKIWRSADLGMTWAGQRSPTSFTLQDIGVFNNASAVAVGNNGVVLRTTDAGLTWEQVTVPRSNVANKLLRVTARANGAAWAVGEMGVVLHSNDAGASWTRVSPEEDAAWNGIFAAGSKVWIVGEFGRIAASSDDGKTWQKIESPAKSSLMSIAFNGERDGVAVGLEGSMYRTADGGKSWSPIKSPTAEHLFDVIWDGEHWAVVGDKGTLLIGDPSAEHWDLKRVAPEDRQWHTRILRAGTRYVVAGGSLQKPAVN